MACTRLLDFLSQSNVPTKPQVRNLLQRDVSSRPTALPAALNSEQIPSEWARWFAFSVGGAVGTLQEDPALLLLWDLLGWWEVSYGDLGQPRALVASGHTVSSGPPTCPQAVPSADRPAPHRELGLSSPPLPQNRGQGLWDTFVPGQVARCLLQEGATAALLWAWLGPCRVDGPGNARQVRTTQAAQGGTKPREVMRGRWTGAHGGGGLGPGGPALVCLPLPSQPEPVGGTVSGPQGVSPAPPG